jgi:hypothetical protein
LVKDTVVVVEISPGTIVTDAVPEGRSLLINRSAGIVLIAVTCAYGTEFSTTVAVPAATWKGAVHVPVWTVTDCVAPEASVTVNVNGPVTGPVVSEYLHNSIHPDELSGSSEDLARAGAANTIANNATMHPSSTFFMRAPSMRKEQFATIKRRLRQHAAAGVRAHAWFTRYAA